MKKIYILATLGLGTLITILVSLACSYWFFHSLMGSAGYQAIGAGIAGCAIQLFGYGFAASFLPIKKYIRFILCIIPLALSILSTYSALYGYLTKEKVNDEITSKKQQMIFDILEQSAKDKEIAASAARKGVSESHRIQAKGFLQMNNLSRDKDEKLLEKLEEQHNKNREASPLDGLVRITGDSELTTILFCAWLAVMFDMLPVIAIGIISQRKSKTPAVEIGHASTVMQKETKVEHLITTPIEAHEVPYDTVVSEFKQGRLQPNYKAVQQYTGWSQWKAQEFFKHCQDMGLLEKEGRTFKMVNHLTVISPVKKAVNS